MGRMAERKAELEALREENEKLHAENTRLKKKVNELLARLKSDDK